MTPMSFEELLALDDEMLFGIISVRIDMRKDSAGRSWKFDDILGFKWWEFYDRVCKLDIHTGDPEGPCPHLGKVLPNTSPEELCKRALALGYIEQAMRASAALRSLGLG